MWMQYAPVHASPMHARLSRASTDAVTVYNRRYVMCSHICGYSCMHVVHVVWLRAVQGGDIKGHGQRP